MDLKSKKILITAGPTWVAIDDVRVISNKASGQTGLLLAQELKRLGAKVVLLLGPVGNYEKDSKIKIIDFKFFEDLEKLLKSLLKNNKFDFIIHSAAVSDFRPVKSSKGKISSDNNINLTLERTPKLISMFKKLAKTSKLIGFKYEVGISKSDLLKESLKLMQNNYLDAVVANTVNKSNKYQAFFVNGSSVSKGLADKKALVKVLVNYIGGGYE